MANQALSVATVYTEANESDDALHLQSTANIQVFHYFKGQVIVRRLQVGR